MDARRSRGVLGRRLMGQGVQREEGERRRSTPAVASAVSRRGGRAHPTRWRLGPPEIIPRALSQPSFCIGWASRLAAPTKAYVRSVEIEPTELERRMQPGA